MLSQGWVSSFTLGEWIDGTGKVSGMASRVYSPSNVQLTPAMMSAFLNELLKLPGIFEMAKHLKSSEIFLTAFGALLGESSKPKVAEVKVDQAIKRGATMQFHWRRADFR